ncbi:MAG: PD-(D/E)XK nuclease family protein [Paludibacteraceae bacterium]|nr:PD-(D/E)XK nuclease family protein [Paludibacteraceae bacterium]MBO7192705.1 PD-(D/E)XK nuclease family protein [Bacteroidaceae bacterium]
MARIELTDSGVLFNEELHEYWLGDKQLSGISEVLRRQLYPNMYTAIPKRILEMAADYGTSVHKSIEVFQKNWINDGTQELQDFIQICKENNLIHEASEYTVTDGKHWASNIDQVFRSGDDTFIIADVKTYSKMTPEKQELARYQLSCYAMFLEQQVKGAKVDRLYIIHLRNRQMASGKVEHIAELIPVERIPADICKELLDCELKGTQFKNPFSVPDDIALQICRAKELIAKKNEAEEELATIKANILSSMEFLDVKSWVMDNIRVTRKLPSTRFSFDLKRFKEKHREISDFDDYMKPSNVAGSLMIAI